MATQNRAELLDNLRAMLSDALRLRTAGGAYAKLARANGCVDGYTRALLDAGLFDQQTLLGLVADVRKCTDGPATTVVSQESDLDASPRRHRAA